MDEEKIAIGIHRIENKGLYYTMSMVQGRYRVPILYCLSLNGPMRYNELKRMIDPVTFRSLALTLKSLEDDGLIIRKDYNHFRCLLTDPRYHCQQPSQKRSEPTASAFR